MSQKFLTYADFYTKMHRIKYWIWVYLCFKVRVLNFWDSKTLFLESQTFKKIFYRIFKFLRNFQTQKLFVSKKFKSKFSKKLQISQQSLDTRMLVFESQKLGLGPDPRPEPNFFYDHLPAKTWFSFVRFRSIVLSCPCVCPMKNIFFFNFTLINIKLS